MRSVHAISQTCGQKRADKAVPLVHVLNNKALLYDLTARGLDMDRLLASLVINR